MQGCHRGRRSVAILRHEEGVNEMRSACPRGINPFYAACARDGGHDTLARTSRAPEHGPRDTPGQGGHTSAVRRQRRAARTE